jgi:hypothetical protein
MSISSVSRTIRASSDNDDANELNGGMIRVSVAVSDDDDASVAVLILAIKPYSILR